jgi:hypothetical protein
MGFVTGSGILLGLGILWVAALLVPTSFQHRGMLFLLLTGVSLLLGVALSLGQLGRSFG